MALVWRNQLGGLTYEVPGAFFVEGSAAGCRPDLSLEAAKLRWAAGVHVRFPDVIDVGDDG